MKKSAISRDKRLAAFGALSLVVAFASYRVRCRQSA